MESPRRSTHHFPLVNPGVGGAYDHQPRSTERFCSGRPRGIQIPGHSSGVKSDRQKQTPPQPPGAHASPLRHHRHLQPLHRGLDGGGIRGFSAGFDMVREPRTGWPIVCRWDRVVGNYLYSAEPVEPCVVPVDHRPGIDGPGKRGDSRAEVSRPGRRMVPGAAPVISPPVTISTPFTNTCSIPTASA
jgi:hypothetical protein